MHVHVTFSKGNVSNVQVKTAQHQIFKYSLRSYLKVQYAYEIILKLIYVVSFIENKKRS